MIQADVRGHGSLVVRQYRGSTRLRKLIDGGLAIHQEQIVEPLCALERQLNLDTAEGAWLDLIGLRLSFPRPSRRVAGEMTQYFGFAEWDADVPAPNPGLTGFDRAPFASLRQLEAYEGVPDGWYRSMLRGRGMALRSGASVTDLEAIAAEVFTGGGSVEDTGPRRATLRVTDFRMGFVEAVRAASLIPRPAGTQLTIVETK